MAFHYIIDGEPSAGMIETFRVRRDDLKGWEECDLTRCGFYYWFSQPGCLPDSDPIGPFRSEAAALRDARSLY